MKAERESRNPRVAAAALAGALALLPAAAGVAQTQPTVTCPAPSDGGLAACPLHGTISHVIYLIKENRSFDNYFGKYKFGTGAVNGAVTATDAAGAVVDLAPASDTTFGCDIDHSWQGAHMAYDCGKMDKFDLINFSDTSKTGGCNHVTAYPWTNHSLTQFDRPGVPNYWCYADHFTLGDNMYSSLMGPSFPNHLYTVGAQSGGNTALGAGAVNNPYGGSGTNGGWGCDMPGQKVQTFPFNMSPTPCTGFDSFGITSSCWDFPVLPDLIASKHRTWRYYAPGAGQSGYIWSALNAIQHIGSGNVNVQPYGNLLTDLAGGGLQDVSWIVFPGSCSEHPPSSVCEGENYTVQIVNALMQSSYWCTTALFIVWDDFGGFYDHVPPPTAAGGNFDSLGPGFRVPMLIVSPYAKPGFVDHTAYDFASLLRFSEDLFGLGTLATRDAGANDPLLNAFNLNQPIPRLILQKRPECPLDCTQGPVLTFDD
jgi:phospholipase C